MNNQFLNNLNGRAGTDTNAVDFFVDGSGSGNCFQGNSSSTFQPSGPGGASTASLYPTCPAPAPPASGTGTPFGDPDLQLNQLLGYVASNPPETMQCSWTEHAHPAFEDFEPYEVPGFNPAAC